jgi:hypothetical protein
MSSRRRRLGRPHSQAQNRSLSCCRRPSIGRRYQEQFGWIAMIIAMVGAFGGGAAVLALGSTDTTGTPAATTRDKTAPNDKPNEEPNEEPMAAGSPHESPTLRSGSKSLRRSAWALAVAASTYRIKPSYVGTQELN